MAGQRPNGRAPSGWSVEPAPVPIRRTAAGRKPAEPDMGQMIAEAVRTGAWLSKTYADRGDAVRAVRRIKYAAARHHVGLLVAYRVTPDGEGWKLSVQITREGKR